MTSQINGFSCISSPVFYKAIQSKLVDVILIASSVALLVIGIIASNGDLNFMGAANAAYLSYGMYGGAALFFLAELIKLALNCVYIRKIDVEKLNSDDSVNEAILEIEIDPLCKKTDPCQHSCKIILSDGRSLNTGLSGYSAYVLLSAINKNKIIFGSQRGFPLGHFPKAELFQQQDTTASEVLKEILRS